MPTYNTDQLSLEVNAGFRFKDSNTYQCAIIIGRILLCKGTFTGRRGNLAIAQYEFLQNTHPAKQYNQAYLAVYLDSLTLKSPPDTALALQAIKDLYPLQTLDDFYRIEW